MDDASTQRGRREAAARLGAVVHAFAGRRIVVLGDLVADEFVHGDIARISREAPVLILEHTHTDVAPGGGGNSVANLRALGAAPLPVGLVGRDEAGRRLLGAFRRRRIDLTHVLREPGYRTPSKSRLLAGGVHTRRQQIVRLDRGATHGELPAATMRRLGAALRRAVVRADALLVADYGYGAATPALVRTVAERLLNAGVVVSVDSRFRIGDFGGVSACTPNQEELERAVGRASLDDAGVGEAGRELLRRTGNRCVLVTRGARGMSVIARRRPALAVPAWGGDEVVDVTGAGDTVIATFTLALACGAGEADAARLANYAAGIVVHKAGTATVSPGELIAAVREDLDR